MMSGKQEFTAWLEANGDAISRSQDRTGCRDGVIRREMLIRMNLKERKRFWRQVEIWW